MWHVFRAIDSINEKAKREKNRANERMWLGPANLKTTPDLYEKFLNFFCTSFAVGASAWMRRIPFRTHSTYFIHFIYFRCTTLFAFANNRTTSNSKSAGIAKIYSDVRWKISTERIKAKLQPQRKCQTKWITKALRKTTWMREEQCARRFCCLFYYLFEKLLCVRLYTLKRKRAGGRRPTQWVCVHLIWICNTIFASKQICTLFCDEVGPEWSGYVMKTGWQGCGIVSTFAYDAAVYRCRYICLVCVEPRLQLDLERSTAFREPLWNIRRREWVRGACVCVWVCVCQPSWVCVRGERRLCRK